MRSRTGTANSGYFHLGERDRRRESNQVCMRPQVSQRRSRREEIWDASGRPTARPVLVQLARDGVHVRRKRMERLMHAQG
jgi:hypothetical protein